LRSYSEKNINILGPAAFGKKNLNSRSFAQEYLRTCTGYKPGQSVKRHGKSCSLHLKKIFCLGGLCFLWVTS